MISSKSNSNLPTSAHLTFIVESIIFTRGSVDPLFINDCDCAYKTLMARVCNRVRLFELKPVLQRI